MNGHASRRVPGILSVTFDGVEGESLLYALAGFAVSSGSACATASGEPSYVLRALGRSDRLAQSTLRLSLGRFNTEAEVDRAIEAITDAVTRLKSVAPGQGG
jgi:cysteine desulfurase